MIKDLLVILAILIVLAFALQIFTTLLFWTIIQIVIPLFIAVVIVYVLKKILW